MPLSDTIFRTAIERSFDAVLVTTADLDDPGPRIVYVNDAFCEMTGYAQDELVCKPLSTLKGPRSTFEVIERLLQCMEAGDSFMGNAINYRKDGTSYHIEWNMSPIRDASGAISHFVIVHRALLEKVQVDHQYYLKACALDANIDQVVMTNSSGEIIYVNRAFENQTGYRREDVFGLTPRILKSGHHDDGFYQGLWETISSGKPFRATFCNKARDDSLYYLEQAITPVQSASGEITHYLATGKDVTERLRMERVLLRMATMDLLTGLANRRYGEDLLEQALREAVEGGEGLSVIIVDLDHFKSINDGFGHEVGDQVLARVGQLLVDLVRNADSAIRWGGEEFVILAPRTRLPDAVALADRVRVGLGQHTHAVVGHITASLGVAEHEPGDTRKSLVKRADEALYAAKAAGRNCVRSFPDALQGN